MTDETSELDDVRAQHETHVNASAFNTKESQAVMNLNLKLQSSAVKTLGKTIELELRRLEAAQLAEHLRIVQVRIWRIALYVADVRKDIPSSSVL